MYSLIVNTFFLTIIYIFFIIIKKKEVYYGKNNINKIWRTYYKKK